MHYIAMYLSWSPSLSPQHAQIVVHMLPASVGVTVTDGVESHYYQQQKQMQKKPMSCCKVGVHIVCVCGARHNSHAQFACKFSSGECASVTAVLYSLTQVSCPSILVPDNDTLRSLLEEEHGSLTDPNTMLPPTDIVELLNSTYRIQEDVRLCTILS